MRFRFDPAELVLLRASEQVYGAQLARQARPDALRTALALAKIGQKVGRAAPGVSVSFEESESRLVEQAIRATAVEVKWLSDRASEAPDQETVSRRTALAHAFPDLGDRGRWKSFGLSRDLEALADRLSQARRDETGSSVR